ncbi:MAG: hypothetical protein COA62_14815 [Rhodobiaceae bacterium]|nr:MAG: hypothetical protein COA62_14815 [Rhodobiaceae bacterium]
MARARTLDDDLLIKVMKRAARPLSAYDLLDLLPDEPKPKPPVIYRALDRLSAKGQVHRIESLKAFIACDGHKHNHETVFTICTDCNKVEEIEDHGLCDLMSIWKQKTNFTAQQKTFEILGQCAKCLAA